MKHATIEPWSRNKIVAINLSMAAAASLVLWYIAPLHIAVIAAFCMGYLSFEMD